MSPSASFPKIVKATFNGANTNDPVSVQNTRTGETVYKDRKSGNILRIDSRMKAIVFAVDNFVSGWTVGDVIVFSVGGTTAGTATVTLTAAKNAPQTSSVTTAAVSTAVLTI